MESQQKIDLERKLENRNGLATSIETMVTFMNIFTAICGNLLVCWTIFKHPRLRSTSNIYIACLAVSDALIAALGFPFTLAVLLTGRWPFNKASCDFQGFAFTVFGTVSLLTMTLTAIARYFKVTRPSLHRKIYSKRNIFLSVSTAFIVSTAFPVILIFNDAFRFHPGKFICIYDCDNVGVPMCLTMGVFLIMACYGPIVFCNFGIFRSVRQHNNQLWASREEQQENKKDTKKRAKMRVEEIKVSKLLFAIVIAFTCCWSPLLVIDAIGIVSGNYWMPREVYMLYTYLSGYSSSVNPVIYGMFNQQLRREFCQIFRCRRQRRERVLPQT